jgi:hypothetical protein
MTISTDDVRRLFRSDEADSVLVLVEGRTDVIAASRLASEEYRGALEVISRDELVKRVGDTPSDHELAEQAALLDITVNELGG